MPRAISVRQASPCLASFAGSLSPNTLKAQEATGYRRASIKHSVWITVNLQAAEHIQNASLIPKIDPASNRNRLLLHLKLRKRLRTLFP
jgi:hypothetical protein